MEILPLFLLFIAGILAAIMNTVGGGGSVLTIPAMIFLGGVPEVSANATNRLGIVVQNMTALRQFRQKGVKEDAIAWRLTIWALPGVIIGAFFASHLSNEAFRPILAVIMLILLALILLRPKPHLSEKEEGVCPLRSLPTTKWFGLGGTMFLLGIYMGFLQAGAGIMLLVILGWFLKMDLLRGNYVKLFLIFFANILTIGIFMATETKIYWMQGIALLLGQVVGAYVGSWVALEKGEGWMKAILTVSILASSAKLLGLF